MAKEKKTSHQQSILFDIDLFEKLEVIAKREGRSVGAQVRFFVSKGLDEDRQKAEI